MPHLQYVEADTEGTFEGISVTQANCLGLIFASVLVRISATALLH